MKSIKTHPRPGRPRVSTRLGSDEDDRVLSNQVPHVAEEAAGDVRQVHQQHHNRPVVDEEGAVMRERGRALAPTGRERAATRRTRARSR